MCLVCVAASSPEIMVTLGGYAAARGAKPIQRVKSLFGANPDTEQTTTAPNIPDPTGQTTTGHLLHQPA